MTDPAAEKNRQRAVDPTASVWVAASAGTGKTTVLTDRLLNLMLDDTDPSHILCLTFTRAAAAEMSIRLNKRLSEWATLAPGALVQQLVRLTGHPPHPDTVARARQLFARVLDTPGGAKIATIHAFCQSLLRRFPLEARVPPEFAVMDERSAAEALAESGKSLLNAARDAADPRLAEALAIVSRYTPEERFTELMGAFASERGRLRQALAEGEAGLRSRLGAALSLPADATAGSLAAAFCAVGGGDEAGLRGAAEALLAGSDADQRRGQVIADWCADPAGRAAMLDNYLGAYLTDEGEIRSTLITKPAASQAAGDVRCVLRTEAERVLCFREARAGAVTLEASCALARLGAALLRAYDERKARHGLLDYDDLIEKALALLHRPGIAPWVLFKLDGGLDHILIDEAQDTNPEQWEIVAALAEEFFAGEDPRGRWRTVFAVGDAKQSIYSFQRADPHAFLRMRQHFEERITAANRDWRIVPLDISFRATEPLLRAIDAVFGNAAAAAGVALDGGEIRHVAHRAGHAGLVELWPPVMPEPDEPADPTALPVEWRRSAAPRTRLAKAIAATIAGWLEHSERLASRGRAMRPGDIMVLVRRRNEFVSDLLRALKQRNVPVAGADRLVLTSQLAVQDLVALGRFLLLPEDDLTLATVLKGPLFGLSEEDLFDLAHNRGDESLWNRLRRRAPEDLLLRHAAARLSALLARADFVPPYELYAEILGAGGGRRAMLKRLGPEAADPLEEFLALALAYEREHVPSLQGFLRWLVARDSEVKRDFAERQRDELRIMTVHGAKGLEAPVVFLPDTLALPDPRLTVLWTERQQLPLWRPRGEFTAPLYAAERAALRQRQLQEYRRLLYVALTRAQDRLYVCGWQGRAVPKDPTWHALCRSGWAGIATPFEFDSTRWIGADGWRGEGLRIEGMQRVPPKGEPAATEVRHVTSLPRWAVETPAPEPDPPKPLLPSRPSGSEPATLSPLAVEGRDRFKRGLLVHRLLQGLPELPEAERETAARRFLALPLHGLSPDERDELCRETMAVLRHPDFAALWGPGSQAEVPLVGLVPGPSPGSSHALSGQIDRLVVTDDRVLIVDFKTVRPPPSSEAEVPPVYLRQLALYRDALVRIYPGRAVECALLWTEGPRLMVIGRGNLEAPPP
jgi:ATP-dependent helicase/nuclease subunit A